MNHKIIQISLPRAEAKIKREILALNQQLDDKLDEFLTGGAGDNHWSNNLESRKAIGALFLKDYSQLPEMFSGIFLSSLHGVIQFLNTQFINFIDETMQNNSILVEGASVSDASEIQRIASVTLSNISAYQRDMFNHIPVVNAQLDLLDQLAGQGTDHFLADLYTREPSKWSGIEKLATGNLSVDRESFFVLEREYKSIEEYLSLLKVMVALHDFGKFVPEQDNNGIIGSFVIKLKALG